MKKSINYQQEKEKLKDNPDFKTGIYWGNKIAKYLDKSKYFHLPRLEGLEKALQEKKEFAEMLHFQLEYQFIQPDLAEAIGYVVAIQEALDKEQK